MSLNIGCLPYAILHAEKIKFEIFVISCEILRMYKMICRFRLGFVFVSLPLVRELRIMM